MIQLMARMGRVQMCRFVGRDRWRGEMYRIRSVVKAEEIRNYEIDMPIYFRRARELDGFFYQGNRIIGLYFEVQ